MTPQTEILAIRKALGWSQRQMADALAVSQASVSRWETGVDEVSETALRLARTFTMSTRSEGESDAA